MDHQSHEPARFWYYYDFSPLQPGRYYCGDCFQLLPAIESGTVDMVLIDPPYYMGKDKAWDCFEGRADYMAFMGRAFIQAQRILKENGTLGFWHNDLQKITWLCDWLERNTDMRFATWGIWVKPNHRRKIWVNPGPGNTLRSWFNIGEFCVFFVKGTAGTAWNKTGLELAKLNTENFGSLRDYFRRLLEYTDAFDGKCDAYIEGYRFIPSGQTWTRADGTVFVGEMIAPWKPWDELDAAQREFEREQYQALAAQNSEYEEALSEIEEALGV